MPRRPPVHLLPNGFVLRQHTVGMPVGRPLSEWAYVTPDHPDGLRTSDLQEATPLIQASTARFWFILNYIPFDAGRLVEPKLASDRTVADERWTPEDILTDEFANVLPVAVLDALANELRARSHFWVVTPENSQIHLSIAAGTSTQDDIRRSLDRLERQLDALAGSHGSIGHNQDPPILEEAGQAVARDAIHEARIGIEAGTDGVASVANAKATLANLVQSVGKALLAGFVAKGGGEAFDPIKHDAILLFHRLEEAVAALGHWLAWLSG